MIYAKLSPAFLEWAKAKTITGDRDATQLNPDQLVMIVALFFAPPSDMGWFVRVVQGEAQEYVPIGFLIPSSNVIKQL